MFIETKCFPFLEKKRWGYMFWTAIKLKVNDNTRLAIDYQKMVLVIDLTSCLICLKILQKYLKFYFLSNLSKKQLRVLSSVKTMLNHTPQRQILSRYLLKLRLNHILFKKNPIFGGYFYGGYVYKKHVLNFIKLHTYFSDLCF